MTTTGELPQSTALVEAEVESLTELFSRDPEGYSSQDLDRIILTLREQRTRFIAAESEARTTGKKMTVPRTPKVANLKITDRTAGDLGI